MSDFGLLTRTAPIVEVAPAQPRTAAGQHRVPELADLRPGAAAPDLSRANVETLLKSLSDGVDAQYEAFQKGLAEAIATLKEPPPPPEESMGIKLIAFLVEGLSTMALGKISGAVVHRMTERLSSTTTDALKETLHEFNKGATQWLHKAVAHSNGSDAKDSSSQPLDFRRVNIAQRTLLDEFRARQEDALFIGKVHAKERLSIIQESVEATDHDALLALSHALDGLDDGRRWFQQQVTIGWMNFAAALALECARADHKPSMPFADQAGGYARGGIQAIQTWRGPVEGFIDVAVEVPANIDGTAGLNFAGIEVDHFGPGAADILREVEGSVMDLAMYRRVRLVTRSSLFDSGPAFVITPTGEIQVDGDNRMLAAIGRGVPTSVEPIGSMHPGSAVNAGDLVRADEARQGAAMVTSWLVQQRPQMRGAGQ